MWSAHRKRVQKHILFLPTQHLTGASLAFALARCSCVFRNRVVSRLEACVFAIWRGLCASLSCYVFFPLQQFPDYSAAGYRLLHMEMRSRALSLLVSLPTLVAHYVVFSFV